MNLPASVIAAKEKAEAIQKQLNEPAPKQEGKPDQAPTQPTDTVPKADTPDYQTRYQTLKGKYDAEVPRLQSEVRNLQEQMLTLRQENERLKTAETEKPKDPPPSNVDYDALEAYGPEIRELGETLTAVVKRNEQLVAEIKKLNGSVETVQKTSAQDAYDKFMDKVRTEVAGLGGNFDALNTDPAFLAWLHQVPPGSQYQRIALLNDAERRHDVIQCRAVFKEYIDTQPNQAQKKDPPNVQPPPSPDPGNPGEQQGGKRWTRKEIKQFYADKASGKYAGREDQAKAIEQDIFAAPGQGRVVG